MIAVPGREDEISLEDLDRKYGGVESTPPPDRAAAVLIAMEDAVSATQEARWHSSRRQPTIPIGRDARAGFGRRLVSVEQQGWDASVWDAYFRAFSAHLVAMDVALVATTRGDNPSLLSVVDLRQWEPYPGDGIRLDEPVVRVDPNDGWRRRGRWRRFTSSLSGR